ncbi:uncharacterized protein ISCGN_008734 [Ixodes scapularis]
MSSSDGALITAQPGRGDKAFSAELEYSVHLPPLPTGPTVLNSVFLHADVKGRPYRVEDFRDALTRAGLLADVVSLGSYQMNHVWLTTFKSNESKKKLVEARELVVKDRRCIVIDPNGQNVRLKVHWLPHHVSDDEVRTTFSSYGKVTDVTREKWRIPGCEAIESNTRTVLVTLKAGVTVEKLPHQVRIAGGMTLVVAPGRAPLCLRCYRTGHIRRECRVPKCSECRRFGHAAEQCVRTYAAVAGPAGGGEDTSELLMDEADMEEEGATAKPVLAPTPEGMTNVKALVPSDDKQIFTQAAVPKAAGAVCGHPASVVTLTEKEQEVETGADEVTDITMTNAGTQAVKRSRETDQDPAGTLKGLGEAEPPSKTTPGRPLRLPQKARTKPPLDQGGKGAPVL